MLRSPSRQIARWSPSLLLRTEVFTPSLAVFILFHFISFTYRIYCFVTIKAYLNAVQTHRCYLCKSSTYVSLQRIPCNNLQTNPVNERTFGTYLVRKLGSVCTYLRMSDFNANEDKSFAEFAQEVHFTVLNLAQRRPLPPISFA